MTKTLEELEVDVKTAWEALQECKDRHELEAAPLRGQWLESEQKLKEGRVAKEVAYLVAIELAKVKV